MNSTLSGEKCGLGVSPLGYGSRMGFPSDPTPPSEVPFQDKVPSFNRTQRVKFVGGEGVVRNCKFEGGTWTYLVEMDLGPAPKFGRVGAETMVLLDRIDLRAA
ncbi:hypothetical protein [Chamaesiphon sp. GL140_3_metabinner_50]|uniref:hypothetical protein n=1 Tax=Chamaesiphon sp. GL140_3_metabinner_50 TaxID=2970812 RepID=UPI0025D81AA4|nr:hypothetical protein [Chamaesiphon sp. GL140_3_metabinner_50]